MEEYKAQKNRESIDGIAGLRTPGGRGDEVGPAGRQIRLVEASGESGLDQTRHLFRSYAAEFAGPPATTEPASG